MRGRSARSDAENGAGTLEIVGVVVVAAVLVAAVVAAIIRSDPAIQARVEQAICEILSAGDAGDCGAPVEVRLPEDYVPPAQCVVAGDGAATSGGFSLVVTVEGGETWFIEELGDGTYRLTRAGSVDVGAGVGVGFDVSATWDDHTYGLALYANASAMIATEQGDVFYADSREMADAILAQQRTSDTKDSLLGPLRGPWDSIQGHIPGVGDPGEYENLEPDEWWVEGGLELNGSAGAVALWESAEVEGQVGAYLGTTQRADGTSSDYFRAHMSGSGSAEAWFEDGQGVAVIEGEAEALVELDRDADGNVVALRLTSALMGNADAGFRDNLDAPTYTERTVQIPIETEADRDLAHRTLQTLGIPYVPGISEDFSPADMAARPLDLFDTAEEFGEVARERGYVYEEVYTLDTNERGGNFDAKLIAELGLSGEHITSQRQLVDYRYWDGVEMAQREGCVA